MSNEETNLTTETPVAAAAQPVSLRVGKYFEVEPGVEVYYEDEGEGRPLVLVPGWTFTTKVFDHQFAAFSGSHRVISFDPRSHGRSTVTLEGNNYATHAQDLGKLLAHLEVKNPVLIGWSTGVMASWHHVRNVGTDGLAAFVNIDMPPIGTSHEEGDWIEGTLDELAGLFQSVQSPAGLRGIIQWYADNVMIEQDISSELMAWIVQQTMSTPPLIAAHLIADVSFANYLPEAQKVDANIPSMHFTAAHWGDIARAFIEKNCPKSEFESFGGHMMYWEYHERFNAILSDFLKRI